MGERKHKKKARSSEPPLRRVKGGREGGKEEKRISKNEERDRERERGGEGERGGEIKKERNER